jgi:outer membrane immunogenic protein
MRFLWVGVLGVALASPSLAQEHNWSGLYLGAHGGYARGGATTTDDPADWGNDPKYIGPFDFDLEGGFGGGTIGANWQRGRLVLGVEADLGHMDLSGATTSESSNPLYHQDHTVDGGFYAVLAGRLGLAFGHTLLYGKAGWAYYDGDAAQTTTKPGFVTNSTGAFDGWAYGGGIEHAIGRGWSLKAEYLRLDLDGGEGDQTSLTDDQIGHVYEFKTDLDAVDTIKVGIVYNFWASEPVAIAPIK